MTKTLFFSEDEFETRLARVRAAYAEAGADAIFVSDPNNICYLTGYLGVSHYVPQGVFITADSVDFIMREMDVRGAMMTTWLADDAFHGYSDMQLLSEENSPWHALADLIERRGGANKRLGFDISANFISPMEWRLIESLLPNATLVNTRIVVNKVRAVKSAQEQVYMREAAAISDAAILAGVEAIEPGVRECDAAAEVVRRLTGGTPEAGGGMPYPPMMPAGEKVSTPHLIWTDDPYRPDSQVNMEVGAMRHWYVAPASRSVYLGAPPQALIDLEKATVAGMEAALEIVKEGVLCEDVERTFRTETRKYGFEKESRIGYAVGLGFLPPGWIELTSSLAPGDKTVMRAGMTYHLMLGMWLDAQSLVMSETFIVTENGHERLSALPRRIFVK